MFVSYMQQQVAIILPPSHPENITWLRPCRSDKAIYVVMDLWNFIYGKGCFCKIYIW